MSASVATLMTLESIRSVPLFASLDDETASALRALLEVEQRPAGSALFQSGDAGDAMYLVEAGRVRIHIRDADGDDVTLVELARGDFFGEMAIIDGKPRSASATVVEDARLAVLPRADFLDFVRRNPDVALKMLSAISTRLRRTDDLLRHRVSRNVNEEEASRLTLSDRMADLIAEFGGSWKFIGAAMAFMLLWIVVNTFVLARNADGTVGFDPYPYVLLNLVLAVITGMQAPLIMMSQNRQSEKDRLRADLDYQVNLKNELALAEVMRRLDVLESERLPLLFAEQNARLREHLGNGKL
ncbi:MAG TPA: DUF1003 domain-containing protein [Pyrinomonadaceae bacterium]|jgi:uncharacterized membrane protein|nr:DUF1003 domain-containing protein [Pyrinomonadaceae bacterium]